MSVLTKWVTLSTGGVILSSLLSISAGAQTTDEVKALVEDGLSRGMSITVAGRLSDGAVSVVPGSDNNFDVSIVGANLYEVSLPDVYFSIAKGEGALWSIENGRLGAPVDYRGGNGHDEASLASFEWSGTWNSENNEYLALSIALDDFHLQGREFGIDIDSLNYALGAQDEASGEIAVDYSFGTVSYNFGMSSAISVEGMASDISGQIEATSSNSKMAAVPGYRPFQWLSVVSNAIGEADTIEDDVAKQAAYMRDFVIGLFQGIDNSQTTYRAQNYAINQVIEGSLVSSVIQNMTGEMETSHNEDGSVFLKSIGRAQDYQVTGNIPEMGGDIDFVLKKLAGDVILHEFNAAVIETTLLSLIDRHEAGELDEPLPSDILTLVQAVGGFTFNQSLENMSGATSFMGPLFDAGKMAFDFKLGAPMEEGNRLESEYGLSIEGFSTPFVAMHPAGPAVAPTQAMVTVGLEHDRLSAMIEKADLTEEEKAAFESDLGFWDSEKRSLELFTKLWNGSSPRLYGEFQVEGPGYDLEIEWSGDANISPPTTRYGDPEVSGQVDILVKGLDTVQGKLSELSQMELDAESQQAIFGATAGLGMAMGFGRPTDDGRTRFLIEFEAPNSVTINGMQLPF